MAHELFIRILNAYEADDIQTYDQLLVKFQENIARSEYTREFDNTCNDSGQVDIRIATCVGYIQCSVIFKYIINNNLAKSFILLINYFLKDLVFRCFHSIGSKNKPIDMYFLNTDQSYPTQYNSLLEYVSLNLTTLRKIMQYDLYINWLLYEHISNIDETNIASNYKFLNLYLKYAVLDTSYSTQLIWRILKNQNVFILSILITYNLVPKNNFDVIHIFYKLTKKNPKKFTKLFNKYLLSFDDNDFDYGVCFLNLFRNVQKEAKFCKWFFNTFPNAPLSDERLLYYYIEDEDICALRFYKYIGVKPTEEDLKNSPQEIRKLFL